MLPTTLEDDEETEEDEPQILAAQMSYSAELRVTNPDLSPTGSAEPVPPILSAGPLCAVPSEASMYSSEMSTSQEGNDEGDLDTSPELPYLAQDRGPGGNLELDGDEGSDEELHAVLKSAKITQGHFGGAPGTGRDRKAGRKVSKSSSIQQPSQETTPRMEGIGSGMRSSQRKDNNARLLVARLQERARRGLQQQVLPSSSDTTASESEGMSTPRVGYTNGSSTTSSDGEMSSTSDCPSGPSDFVERRPSRKLPYPPSNALKPDGAPMRHSHIGMIRKPPGPPKGIDLWGNRIAQPPPTNKLPHPPAIPQISGKITATSLRMAKTLHGETTMSDSERKAITRPPKSPARPPRSPLRINRGSLSVGDEPNNRELSPIREKITTLEHRVHSNGV